MKKWTRIWYHPSIPLGENEQRVTASAEHIRLSKKAAQEGMVLLKNDNNALPFSSKNEVVSLFGVTSYDFITGGTGSGSVNNKHTVSLLEGLNNSGFKIDQELANLYVPFAEKEALAEKERRKSQGILALPQRLPEMEMTEDFINNKQKILRLRF